MGQSAHMQHAHREWQSSRYFRIFTVSFILDGIYNRRLMIVDNVVIELSIWDTVSSAKITPRCADKM